jgi:D-arabinose 1-dehydrogenase-like Zn-dependent alcohol dehydrogenase
MIALAGFSVNRTGITEDPTMKAAVWKRQGQPGGGRAPGARTQAGLARLKVAAAGICGTDLHFYRGSFPSPKACCPAMKLAA